VLLAVLLLGLGVEAQAKVLCQDKTTKALFVRTKCKVSERQVNPVTLGLQGPPGPAAVVKDTNGEIVGVAIDKNTVLRSVENTLLAITIDYFSGDFSRGVGFYYESTDCSGTALLPATPTQLFAVGQVRGTTLYYAPTGSVLTVASQVLAPRTKDDCESASAFIPPDGCCINISTSNFQSPFGPTLTLDLSSLVPPFHIELQP
jgi:hypothetical protein